MRLMTQTREWDMGDHCSVLMPPIASSTNYGTGKKVLDIRGSVQLHCDDHGVPCSPNAACTRRHSPEGGTSVTTAPYVCLLPPAWTTASIMAGMLVRSESNATSAIPTA